MRFAPVEERVAPTARIGLWRAAHGEAEAGITRLHQILKALDRARFGRRSERLDHDQIAFAFEEVEKGLGAIEAGLYNAGSSVNGLQDSARRFRPIASGSRS